MIYLHTDADREFAALLAIPRVAAGYPASAEPIAARAGARLDRFALDPTGRAVGAVPTLVWLHPGPEAHPSCSAPGSTSVA